MGIVVLKLISGEEVIAKEVESLAGSKYARPRVLQMMQTEQGMGLGLVPFLISSPDAEVEISPRAIVASIPASKQIEDAYLRQTSGLEIATKF